MTGGSGLTTMFRMHYENSEAEDFNETIMKLWRYGTTWTGFTATAYDSVNNYIEVSGLTTIAGTWGLGTSISSITVSDINGGSAIAGDSVLYTINVTNPYKVTKNSIVLSDTIDNNLIIKSGTISSSGVLSGATNNGSGSLTGGQIVWPTFSLASGGSASYTFKANTDSAMDVSEAIVNRATINFGSAIEFVSSSITISNYPNIAIDTNIVSDSNPVPGDTLIYTLKFRNTGTSNATTVALTYTIPSNTSFVTNAFAAGKGIEVNGTAVTNTADGDEGSLSGSNVLVNVTTLTPGSYKQVRFKTVIN
jgi:uncharacterized repeat protein (TIGR01451 family)